MPLRGRDGVGGGNAFDSRVEPDPTAPSPPPRPSPGTRDPGSNLVRGQDPSDAGWGSPAASGSGAQTSSGAKTRPTPQNAANPRTSNVAGPMMNPGRSAPPASCQFG